MSNSAWFASSDNDEDLQNFISSTISVGFGIAATVTGVPWLMFGAAPLQILAKRALQMWTGKSNRPTRAFGVGGQQSFVTYQPFSGIDVNLIPSTRRLVFPQEITGQFINSNAGARRLLLGDPVALVITNTSWGAQNNGLVVPAKFGESFRIRLPLGEYSLSAFSLDSSRQPRVDPITAMGVGHLPRGATALTTPLDLHERQTVMTRSLLTDLRRQTTSIKTTTCPHCGRPLYVRFITCPNCGKLLLDNLGTLLADSPTTPQQSTFSRQKPLSNSLKANPGTPDPRTDPANIDLMLKNFARRTTVGTTNRQAARTVRCSKCSRINFASSSRCFYCGTSLILTKLLLGLK